MADSSILIVDDEPMMTEMVSMLLELYVEAEIVATNDSLEAQRLLEGRNFDLLITDYLMPSLNGLELVKNVRSKGNNLPIIVLTGYYDNPELEEGTRSFGSFEVMVKPWNNDALVAKVQQLLS